MASPTGLSQLGDALLRGSGDYANIQLRRQAEERQRSQQLADLQDQRKYSEGQRDIQRGMALEDTTVGVLIKEGWLKPTDARDPLAVKAAADARQARIAATQQREANLPQQFQAEADYLGQQDAELSAEEAKLNAALTEPMPGQPSPAEVRRVAIRMTNKQVPSEKEISDMLPAATDAIISDRFTRWSMNKENARNQIQLLRSQRTALRQSLTGLLQQGFVPNRPPPSAPGETLSAPASSLRPVTAEAAAAAAGDVPPPTSPPATPAVPASYGGVMGLAPSMGTLGAAFSNPAGALEIGTRAALGVPASALNFFTGGDRRLAEGNAQRDVGMAGALQAFNAPAAPLPTNPFWQGNFMPALSPLPQLKPSRSPAAQLAPVF